MIFKRSDEIEVTLHNISCSLQFLHKENIQRAFALVQKTRKVSSSYVVTTITGRELRRKNWSGGKRKGQIKAESRDRIGCLLCRSSEKSATFQIVVLQA